MLFGAIHDGGTDESDCKIIYRKLDHLPPAQNDTEGKKKKRFFQ